MRTRTVFAAATAGILVATVAAAVAFSVLADASGGGRSGDRVEARPTVGNTGNSLAWLALLNWPTRQPTPPPQPTNSPEPPVELAPAEAPVGQQPPAFPAVVVREWLDLDFAAQVLASVNAQRAANGLAALSTDGALAASAQDFAHQLTQLGSLSHTATGVDLRARVAANGYSGGGSPGEALWFGQGAFSPGDVVAGWMASPPHSAIILDPTYRVAGTGCFFKAAGSDDEERCVLELGG